MSKNNFQELTSLFFETKQTIRANLPRRPDPNAWMRCETLRFIDEHEQPTMREIAKHLQVTAPSATSLMRKLFELGWIERTSSGSDKRIVRISLTADGRREVVHYRKQGEKTMKKVFSKLPERDLAHLKRILRTVNTIHKS
ncbi:MAG: MarR family transcriptional regulator [Candidatus Pacebacteria bacterium]|nr:MarR family transcriptional regulator [Candidatus Paceibacterota bacterium]